MLETNLVEIIRAIEDQNGIVKNEAPLSSGIANLVSGMKRP